VTIFQAIVLGIVQGVTEFLPVSSSGHLVIVPEFLSWPTPPVSFDVLLHLATVVAVVVYFARDLGRIAAAFVAPRRLPPAKARALRRLGLWLLVGTIPAGLAGVLLKGFFESLFASTAAVGAFLMLGGVLMLIADLVVRGQSKRRTLASLGLVDAVVVGLFQALAIAPGLSRSGATISGGIYLGLDRESAARFSFLLAIPVILGAVLVDVGDLAHAMGNGQAGTYLAGALAALVSGVLAIAFMLRFLRTHRLLPFVIYSLVVGALVLGLSLI
jgi:undecaprenyl-diphosphatase